MAGAPCDGFAEADDARGHTVDRSFSRLRHGAQVRIDVDFEIENRFRAGRNHGAALEVDHGRTVSSGAGFNQPLRWRSPARTGWFGPSPNGDRSEVSSHAFRFDIGERLGPWSRLSFVHPGACSARIEHGQLSVLFGRWSLTTPVSNIADVTVTGPYTWRKAAGPAHLSVADRASRSPPPTSAACASRSSFPLLAWSRRVSSPT